MAAYITTCILIASMVICAHAGVDQCPPNLSRTRNLMQFFSSCYEYHLGQTKSWKEADKICKAGGGYLVSINSASEQASVFNGLQLLNSNKDVWIGLSDHITADNWQWSSGQPLTYKNWAPGQPGMAGSLEDCALMKHGDSGHWHDYPCDDILFVSYNYNFICEYPIV